MSAHVFSAPTQPLTDYRVPIYLPSGKTKHIRFTNEPSARWRCHSCRRVRHAKNLVIQVYYDMSVITCREGHDYIKRGWYERVVTRKARRNNSQEMR